MSKVVKNLQSLVLQLGGLLPKFGVDGDLGIETKNAIDSLDIPEWIKTAMKEVGVHEIKGSKHNPRVVEYHSVTGGYSNDEVPWCGSFIAWCLKQNDLPIVKVGERAKSWSNYGVVIKEPVIGAIAVKSRKGGGHVCFVVGQDSKGYLYCLGGNQNDEVNIAKYKKEVFEDFRLPLKTLAKLPTVDISSREVTREA